MSDGGVGGFESAAGTAHGRFRSFDGLRALAAMAVLVTHAGAISGFTFRSSLGAYVARGEVGVPIFFVISGFLLYRPFAKAHLEGGATTAPAQFWRRRASRIFPAYWVALTFVPLVFGHRLVTGVKDVVVYYGLLQIYDTDRVLGGLYQAWSLCTEVGFYLVLPVYAALLARRRRTAGSQLRVELTGLAVLYVASVGFRVYLVATDARGPQFTWTLAWLDVFALGMALAVVSVWASAGGRLGAMVAVVERRAGVCWFVALGAFVALCNLGIPRTLVAFSPLQRLGGQFLSGMVAVALIAPAALDRGTSSRVKRVLNARVVVAAGVISYSFYLWHAAMLDKAVKVTHGHVFAASLLPVLVVALVFTIAVSVVSYRVIEKPASAVGDDNRIQPRAQPS